MTSRADDLRTRRQIEQERLEQLAARRPKDDSEFAFTGVLLSDAIKKCCDYFGLITPFEERNLKPANYTLRIGDEYAISGKIYPLSDSPGQAQITIKPFEVAIIKTLETINMPAFLIGRWNIQVSKAYKGLLWVGGPQVDAGYVGNLFCPIYNLSERPVTLNYGDPIAVIDFEKTTSVTPASKSYPFPPEKILFQDYEPETLQSALATQAEDKIKEIREPVRSVVISRRFLCNHHFRFTRYPVCRRRPLCNGTCAFTLVGSKCVLALRSRSHFLWPGSF
jgi:deoxycytidine triphosphate deaminase